jgi:maltooligosyltrehalose trehalohydrolase
VLNAYRELIALRKARPELTDPWLDEVEVDVDEDARTLLLHRGLLRLAVNLGDGEVTFALGVPIRRVLLASEPVEVDDDALTVGPEAFAIADLG